jgi:hypothetical protein
MVCTGQLYFFIHQLWILYLVHCTLFHIHLLLFCVLFFTLKKRFCRFCGWSSSKYLTTFNTNFSWLLHSLHHTFLTKHKFKQSSHEKKPVLQGKVDWQVKLMTSASDALSCARMVSEKIVLCLQSSSITLLISTRGLCSFYARFARGS